MELPTIKALSALALLLLTFFASMSPLCIFRQPSSLYDPPNRYYFRRRILSFLSCFAGGVFLGTCLLHLFPDVTEQVNCMVKSLSLTSKFPITEFLIGFGFLAILIVEQIVLDFREPVNGSRDELLVESATTTNPNRIAIDQHNVQGSLENSQFRGTTYGTIQVQNEPNEFNISFPQPHKSNSIQYLQEPVTGSESEPSKLSATAANSNMVSGGASNAALDAMMALHVPIKGTRRRCTLCSRNHVQKRTTVQCKECRLALCSEKQNNCFNLYHQLMSAYYFKSDSVQIP